MRVLSASTKKNKTRTVRFLESLLIWTAILCFWLLVWHIASLAVGLKVILPSPIDAITRLFTLFLEARTYNIIIGSIIRILLGTVIAIVLGILLAALSASCKPLLKILEPLLAVIKTTPVVSFIIVAFLWIGSDSLPSFISALMVFPIIYANVLEGILGVPEEQHELAKVFEFSFAKKIKNIYYPNVRNLFLTSVKTSIGLGWKAGIAAEVIVCTKYSIGLEIYNSKTYLETVDLFAWTLLVILLSVVIEILFSILFNLLLKKKGEKK